MIEQFLDAITENCDKYASGKIGIQNYSRSWTETWSFLPRKTVYGRWILPGQKLVKYHHEDMCFKKSSETFKSGSMYQSWFFFVFDSVRIHDAETS